VIAPDAEIVSAILVRDGKLLLSPRNPDEKIWPNTWDILDGHIETGETAEQALVREAGEEAGVTPTAWSLTVQVDLPEARRYATYTVTAWTGGEPVIRNHEHARFAWFTAAEANTLPNLASDRYREIINQIGAGP
jgi:8-oxo-dGTP pyrophosphatase MutT (NUDIX family)